MYNISMESSVKDDRRSRGKKEDSIGNVDTLG